MYIAFVPLQNVKRITPHDRLSPNSNSSSKHQGELEKRRQLLEKRYKLLKEERELLQTLRVQLAGGSQTQTFTPLAQRCSPTLQ